MNEWDRFQHVVTEVTQARPGKILGYPRLLFEHVDLAGKSVLDVGGGTGVMAFYAALSGATRVVCLEPSADGSEENSGKRFEDIRSAMRLEVERVQGHLEEWNEPFDVVLMSNVINHLDERACSLLHVDLGARRSYERHLRRLSAISRDWLIIADCSRANGIASLGLTNPFAPTIEWEKHQRPELWVEMLESVGFRARALRWNAPARLGSVGQLILGNRFGCYLTSSHFILTMKHG